MTGIYMRVKRDGRWQNIELEHLTDVERAKVFVDNEKTLVFLNGLCKWLVEHVKEAQP